jgi:four helix bundle protein
MTRQELQKRTRQFNIDVIKLCNDMPRTPAGFELAKQVIRSSSSVGANYRASARAKSTADFINKINIVLEEAGESFYWLDIIDAVELIKNIELKRLIKEANELTAIFASANKTIRTKTKHIS